MENPISIDAIADGIAPVAVTSNGWSPVEFFNPEHFAGGEEFLVWLTDHEGAELCQVAQWDHSYNESGLPVSDGPHFTGEWRHIERVSGLEPIAFRAMPDGPDYDQLRRIVDVHGKAS